jgi:hypothetical protein
MEELLLMLSLVLNATQSAPSAVKKTYAKADNLRVKKKNLNPNHNHS